VVVLIAAAALATYFFRNSANAPAKTVQISHWNKPMDGAVLSPDGHTVAFTSPVSDVDQIFIMLASGGEPLQLTNDPVNKAVDSFSPDGTQIYYSSAAAVGEEIHSVPTLGGTPTFVAAGSELATSPDQKTLYYAKMLTGLVFRKPRTGLLEEKIFQAPEGSVPLRVLPFPNGKELLIATGNDPVQGSTELQLFRLNLATLNSQKIGVISGSPTGLVWDDAGRILLCSRTVNEITNVWEYRVADGKLAQRTAGAGPDLSPMPSPGKGLYYVNGRRSGVLTAYNTQTKKSQDIVDELATQPTPSRDGRYVGFITLSGHAQQGDLWISRTDGSNRTKVTSGTELVTLGFSSDSNLFWFADTENGGLSRLFVVHTNGTSLRQIPISETMFNWGTASPDPRFFYVGGSEKDVTKIVVWKMSVDGTVEKVGGECGAPWDTSPDGGYLLTSMQSASAGGPVGIAEMDLRSHTCTTVLSDMRTLVVHFSADGKSILYLTPGRGGATIYRQPWRDGKVTGPAQVAIKLPFDFRLGFSGNAYEFTKDLSTVIYARPGGQADLYLLSQQ
jgi:Tol biopolymer transport system component